MFLCYLELFILISIALYTDYRYYKIKNKPLLIFLVLGIITNAVLLGFIGVLYSLLGIIIPFLLLIGFFKLRMLGAGDIKLLSVIGSIMGYNYIINNLIYTILSGGVLAFILMLLRGNLVERLKYAFNYFLNIILGGHYKPYANFCELSEKDKFRFAYAIACGVIVQASSKYLNIWNLI